MRTYKASERIQIRKNKNDFLLINRNGDVIGRANATAVLLLALCETPKTRTEICTSIAAQFAFDNKSSVLSEVADCLRSLVDLGVVKVIDHQVDNPPMELAVVFSQSPKNLVDEYTEVRPSDIHGYGLFAKTLIPEGTVWCYPRSRDVLIIQRDQFLTLTKSFVPTKKAGKPHLVQKFVQGLRRYSHYDEDVDAFIFCLDNARYVNNSDNPNSSRVRGNFGSMALRDIQPSEEITEDYSKYDTWPPWARPWKRGS